MTMLKLDERHQIEQSFSLVEYLNDYIIQNNMRDKGVAQMQRFLNSIATYDRSIGFHFKREMEQRYPDMGQIVGEVLDKAEAEGDCFEYADNFRVYPQRDEYGELLFRAIEYTGCCGSTEGSVVVDGIRYIYGFNYGH